MSALNKDVCKQCYLDEAVRKAAHMADNIAGLGTYFNVIWSGGRVCCKYSHSDWKDVGLKTTGPVPEQCLFSMEHTVLNHRDQHS